MKIFNSVVVTFLLVTCGVSSGEMDLKTKAVVLHSRKDLKLGVVNTVSLEIENPSDRPLWFLYSDHQTFQLPETGLFEAISSFGDSPPVEGAKYRGTEGFLIKVGFYGKYSFTAFRVPEKGRIFIRTLGFHSHDPINKIVIHFCDDLLVNGKTKLEAWVPYEVLSGKSVDVDSITGDYINLDWDSKNFRRREDYPKERIRSVTATNFRSKTIPIPDTLNVEQTR